MGDRVTDTRAAVTLPGFFLALALATTAGCVGVPPRAYTPADSIQELGQDWRRHYHYGLELLESGRQRTQDTLFARAAFSSAARFSRDHAPSFAGLALANLQLGQYAEAQAAFLNAALIDDRSMYWALAAYAALRNGDERVARALYVAMQAARVQDDDPASHFLRAVYDASYTHVAPLAVVARGAVDSADVAELVCDSGSDDARCHGLNIVASVFFVRRTASETSVRGTDFFNNLVFQLGAESSFERPKGDVLYAVHEGTLSIPDIQYAVRLTPLLSNSDLYLNAAPSVITSIGEESQIREGSNLTILYNSTGYSNEFTAETGISLRIGPEEATPDSVKLVLNFELSSVSTLVPSLSAQVLDVSSNEYSISGYFPYGRPLVLGTISSGSQKHSDGGQAGLRRIPLLGGNFGVSREESSTSDTLVLGVLSEPAVFRGSRERRIIDTLRELGVAAPEDPVVRRRKIVHEAPDPASFLPPFLKERAPAN